MEKLLKLLNEYDKINEVNNKWFINDYWRLDREYNWATAASSCRKAISKDYGFIERLVKNDKVELPTSCAIDKNNDYFEREIKSDYESLLMLLAISDNPIKELLLYLK